MAPLTDSAIISGRAFWKFSAVALGTELLSSAVLFVRGVLIPLDLRDCAISVATSVIGFSALKVFGSFLSYSNSSSDVYTLELSGSEYNSSSI